MTLQASPFNAGATVGVARSVEAISDQWLSGATACSQWWVGVLDTQTAMWRGLERLMADAITPWVASAPPPSAQALIEASDELSPQAMFDAIQQSWEAWNQVWANALQHDVLVSAGEAVPLGAARRRVS